MRDGTEQRRARRKGGHGGRGSDEDKNGDFALTVARLALLLRRGGRGEDDIATG